MSTLFWNVVPRSLAEIQGHYEYFQLQFRVEE
jgi:hypothetical protein